MVRRAAGVAIGASFAATDGVILHGACLGTGLTTHEAARKSAALGEGAIRVISTLAITMGVRGKTLSLVVVAVTTWGVPMIE